MFSFLRNVAANSAASPDANIIAMGGVIISMAKTTLMGTSFDLNVQGTDKRFMSILPESSVCVNSLGARRCGLCSWSRSR